MKNKFLIFFLSVIITQLAFGQLETYQERANKNLQLLIAHKEINDQIKIDGRGINIYQPKVEKPEFTLHWTDCKKFVEKIENMDFHSLLALYKQKGTQAFSNLNEYERSKEIPYKQYPSSFEELTIAIDPGHFAGSFDEAIQEDRYVKGKAADLGLKTDVKFYESDLTFVTAAILGDQLKKQGVIVQLTRKKGLSALGKNFNKWYAEDFHRQLDSCVAIGDVTESNARLWRNAKKEVVYEKFFKFLDFRMRSKVINEFAPHITLIIHYNSEEGNQRDVSGYLKPVETNYSVAFVPGGYVSGELTKTDARLDFLRLMISPDLENSMRLADLILSSQEKQLQISRVPKVNNYQYIANNCTATPYQGVYARNLYLTRSVRGIVVFLESLYQDNKSEMIALSKSDYQLDTYWGKIKTSMRCKQVADSYFEGIKTFLKYNKEMYSSAR